MKIVIDIDKDYYEIIKHDVDKGMAYLPCVLIANGIPLPEHHGDIVDIKELRYKVDDNGKVVITAPTIIEGSDSE